MKKIIIIFLFFLIFSGCQEKLEKASKIADSARVGEKITWTPPYEELSPEEVEEEQKLWDGK